ncbi:hypothetical protein EXS70_04350 [Candidatus Peribacteria bacterium]|nr:hypothetical protein [Candidatus Peribacteria bacterium]
MDNRASPIFVVAFVAIALMLCLYGIGNLMCRGAVRDCSQGQDCPNGTACVQYTPSVKRCSPTYCPAVLEQNAKLEKFWNGQIVDRTKNAYGGIKKWIGQ